VRRQLLASSDLWRKVLLLLASHFLHVTQGKLELLSVSFQHSQENLQVELYKQQRRLKLRYESASLTLIAKVYGPLLTHYPSSQQYQQHQHHHLLCQV
jgi:hypothetical protein